MARGQLSQKTKVERALALAAQVIGVSPDDLRENDTYEDRMIEAEAVLAYCQTRHSFKHKTCVECGEVFAYYWDRDAISRCSPTCMAKGLEKLGLTWDPNKDLRQRWGRTAPMVVPPQVLSILNEGQEEEDSSSQAD